MEPQNKNNLAVPVAIVIAGLLIASAILFGKSSPAPVQNQATDKAPSTVDMSKITVANAPSYGQTSAPITLVYWYDYQCPVCKAFDRSVLPTVIKNYIDQGKVKIVFKDFPFLGPDSASAGLASLAVWEVAPQKYYDWHKAMFDKQDGENDGWGNMDDIITLTKSVLGDAQGAQVAKLVESKKDVYQKQLDANRSEGQSLGVRGTPTSMVNGTIVVGVNLNNITAQIDKALKK